LYTYASRPIPYAFSMIAYLCALLTKEAAVFAFILFPLYDYLTMVSPPPQPSPLKGKGKDGGAVKKGGPPGPPLRSKGSISPVPVPRSRFLTTFVLRSIPPLALLAFYFAARAARITLVAGGASADTLTSGHSMANALSAAGLYFKLLVWPYPHHPFIGAIPDSLPVILVSGILLAAAAAGWGISLHRRNRPVGMAFGLMLLTLVPAVLVSFLRVASTPAAERYLYLPSAGFVILVAWAAQIGWRRLSSAGSSNRLLRYTAVLAAGGLLMLGGWQSWKRTLVWRDSTTFWEHAVASSPRLGFPYRELGKHYGGGKNFVQTEASYQQALAVDEKYLGAEDRYVARDLYLLGSLYYERGDFGKAEPFYKRALAIQDKALPPTSPRTADTLNNLALLYYNGKRYDEAEPLFQRAIAIYDQSPAGNAKKLADSLNNLAALYYGQGKLESAEPLYKRSMEIKEKQFGPESLEMASSYNNLAALYYNMKRYDDAEKLFHRALDIKEKRLNPDHPDLAPTLNNLASLAMLEGKYADAEALFQRTIRIREKAYGKDFPGLATTLENYAVLLRQMKRKEEADRMTARAKEIRNKAGKKQVVSGEQ
jgi:tetratricopeptide (TPR) repeat protein